MRNRYKKAISCLTAAALFSVGECMVSYALPAEAPDSGYTEEYSRLQDNYMEYDELEDLIKNYYGPIKTGYEASTSTYTKDMADISSLMYDTAKEMEDEADELEDLMKEGSLTGSALQSAAIDAATNRAMADAYRTGARSMNRSIDSATKPDKQKSLQRSVNQLVYNMQMTMNGYQQVMANRQVAAKAVEISEAAKNLQITMQSQGLAVDADVVDAALGLSSAKSQLASLDTRAQDLKKTLGQFTGWGSQGNPEIGPVPKADIASIALINVEEDKEKAVNNNYNLITLRSGSGGNMDQLQQTMTKSTTRTKNKLRDVEYSENTVRSDIQTLYDTILEKKLEYDAAFTEFQRAQLTWSSAQIQRQSGSISQIQYMQQELSYLQAQAGFQCADLALQQAMQNYSWAVRGVPVSA